MPELPVESVQSSNCSDEPEEQVHRFPPKKKSFAALPDSLAGSPYPPRLPHRTLPPLRQARMPLRPGGGPRPQVLSLGQLSRFQAPTGLHPPAAPRRGRSVTRQLPEAQEPPRSDLRHQPRASSKGRGAVADGRRAGGRGCPHRHRSARHRPRSDALLSPLCCHRLRDRATGGKR